MKSFRSKLKKCFKKIINKEYVKNIINKLSDFYDIDLLKLAYNRIGILNYENTEISGEIYLLKEVLPKLIRSKQPVLIDVGANNGKTTIDFRKAFANADIYAFEPNNKTFKMLESNCNGMNIYCLNLALGELEEEKFLYSYKNNICSGHASLYRDVFNEIHKTDQLEKINIKIGTLDGFALKHNIEYIDFLKIDTEGHEFSILQGAKRLLEKEKIGIIQFEFNEMNVISRVFLKDFFDFLSGYSFFRMKEMGLISLGKYNTINEIFKFQNVLAVHNSYLPILEKEILRGSLW